MGTLRSEFDWTGRDVNGTILGVPVISETGGFSWDGSVADGIIDVDGNIVFNEEIIDSVGEFVSIADQTETTVLSVDERNSGLTKIDLDQPVDIL